MTRPSASLLCGAIFVALLSGPASAADGDTSDTLSGGVILNPTGGFLRYDHQERLGESGLWLGGFANFLFYSSEFGLQLQYVTDPAFFEVHLDLAFEPGLFRRVPRSGPRPQTDPERTAGTRYIAKLQSNINLKFDHIWLYSRTTALYRHRNFRELDTVLQLEVEREVRVEEAVALFARVAGRAPAATETKEKPGLWVYAEYTVGSVLGVGERPNRVSTGLLSENWPGSGTVLNLDLFYSFAEPIEGPGMIFAWWLSW